MHGLAYDVVSTEGEGDITDAATGSSVNAALLDFSDGLDEV